MTIVSSPHWQVLCYHRIAELTGTFSTGNEPYGTQTLPPDEIIAIDDGSTDESLHILEQYSERLPAMRVIQRENGGLSVARNTGLEAAQGKWLSFIDSDDFIEPDYFPAWFR